MAVKQRVLNIQEATLRSQDINEGAISCRANYLYVEGPSSDSNFVNIHSKRCFHGNCFARSCCNLLDFIRDVASWGWKVIEWMKNGKIVVPDLRVDRFSVQCAKAVSKLCSNRAYFYDQSWS